MPQKRSRGIALLLLSYVAFISLGLPDGLLGVAWPSIRTTHGLPLDALGALLIATRRLATSRPASSAGRFWPA